MISKMKYANRRWGCNMFYVDSNGGPADATAPSFFQVNFLYCFETIYILLLYYFIIFILF